MKCPEAVEWMHRYLDHDLNEEESFLLFEHIRSCEECAETFELLNKLSAQLEELPKVVPNYSLVDAILPQLDEIDRARREGGSTAEETILPMTAVHVDTDPGPAGRALPSRRSSRRQDAGSGVRRSRIYRYGSLGVAAALILGVFIYQYEPRTVSDAEIAMNSMASDSVSEDSSAADSAGDAAGNARLFSDGSNAGGLEVGERDGVAPKEEGPPSEGSDSGGLEDRSAPGSSPDAGAPATKPDVDAKAPSKPETGKNDPAGDPAMPPSANNSGAPSQGSTSPGAGNSSDPLADTVAPDGSEDELIERQLTFEDPNQKMGIANFNSWTSPDGKFEAELKDGHLLVYSLETPDRKQVADQTIDGNWVDGAWSEEGHVFTYEIDIEGTPAVRTINAEQAAADAAKGTQP
jgi:hypothetical protein